MQTNVGPVDRLIRLILGLIVAVLGIVFHSWWGLLGLVILGTGLFGWCGLYKLLGLNTCRVK